MSYNKEEMMKWLQKQAHHSEKASNEATREGLSFYFKGLEVAYNDVWRYLEEYDG